MTELVEAIDLGNLPPRAREILLTLGEPLTSGLGTVEIAAAIGERPGFVSEALRELRCAIGFVYGIFPDLRPDEYDALLWSIAEHGVRESIVLDEHGIIDGFARARAVGELAWIAESHGQADDWRSRCEAPKPAALSRADENHWKFRRKEAKEGLVRLANYDEGLIALALEGHWQDPPIDRREGLSRKQRRELAVRLNASPRGRSLRRSDLRTLIEVELMLDRKRSVREIARLVGCDHVYVWRVRKALEEEEAAFAGDPEAEVEVLTMQQAWRPVVALACPHCHHDLGLERAGADFRLALNP